MPARDARGIPVRRTLSTKNLFYISALDYKALILLAISLHFLLLITAATFARAQDLPATDDTRQSMLREAMLGLVPLTESVPDVRAGERCIELPIRPPGDRIQGPHGDVLLEAQCRILEYQRLDHVPGATFFTAKYQWTSVFSAADTTRGADARDIVGEEEVVLFEELTEGQVPPVWHARFETGSYAAWASITPELAPTDQGTVLLSVMSCLNGTGGCGQEFLQRHTDGTWSPVMQDWLDQLPPGFMGRIRHGIRIDPLTLQGEAGFYGDHDPNCCPSQRLVVRLALRGNALILIDQAVGPWPE
jgi:hypothetical protein